MTSTLEQVGTFTVASFIKKLVNLQNLFGSVICAVLCFISWFECLCIIFLQAGMSGVVYRVTVPKCVHFQDELNSELLIYIAA